MVKTVYKIYWENPIFPIALLIMGSSLHGKMDGFKSDVLTNGFKEFTHEKSVNHWDYRPGRFLSDRIVIAQRI
jgi:hypothetical protein